MSCISAFLVTLLSFNRKPREISTFVVYIFHETITSYQSRKYLSQGVTCIPSLVSFPRLNHRYDSKQQNHPTNVPFVRGPSLHLSFSRGLLILLNNKLTRHVSTTCLVNLLFSSLEYFVMPSLKLLILVSCEL